MAVQIIVDSTADFSAKEIEKRQITCIPMTVTFGNEQYIDGVDLTKEEFFVKLTNEKEFPKTSQPSPAKFADCFEEAKENGDDVVAILVSGALSGTVQSATIAKDIAEHDGVYIVDSKSATLGIRLLVDRAVRMRDQGKSAKEIAEALDELKARVRLFAGLDTLEYLRKGGRIGKVTATAGMLLQIKPILTFAKDGQLTSVAKVRGRNQVIDKLVELAVKACGNHRRYNLAVANGGAPEGMALVREKLTAALPNYDHIWEGEIDGTLSVYIGDGVLGAAVQVLSDEDER